MARRAIDGISGSWLEGPHAYVHSRSCLLSRVSSSDDSRNSRFWVAGAPAGILAGVTRWSIFSRGMKSLVGANYMLHHDFVFIQFKQ